jgi:hypothetical protein
MRKTCTFLLSIFFLTNLTSVSEGKGFTSFSEVSGNILNVVQKYEAICNHRNNNLDQQTCRRKWNNHPPILSKRGVRVKPFYTEQERIITPRRFQKRFGFKILLKKGYVEASKIIETIFKHQSAEKEISWVHISYFQNGKIKPARVYSGPLNQRFDQPPNNWTQPGLGDNPSAQFYDEGILKVIQMIDDFEWTLSDRGGYPDSYVLPNRKGFRIE